MKIPAGFELIGHVSVDSGTLMVGDPCYLDGGFDYSKWCSEVDYTRKDGICPGPNDFGDEKFGRGTFAVSTAHGDGEYPIYGLKDSRGKITAFLVDTDPEPEDDGDMIDWDAADDEWNELEADRSFGGYGDM